MFLIGIRQLDKLHWRGLVLQYIIFLSLCISPSAWAQEERGQPELASQPGNHSTDGNIDQQMGRLQQSVGYLSERIKDVENKNALSSDKLTSIYIAISVIATLFVTFFVTIVLYIRSGLKRYFTDTASKISEQISNKLSSDGESKISEIENRFEETMRLIDENYFKYSQIIALRYAKQYDDALDGAGWSGDYSKLLDLPHSVQRSLIVCLAHSIKAKQADEHLQAWRWAKELAEKSSTVENIESMIRTGNSLKSWDEVIEKYLALSSGLSDKETEKLEPHIFVSYRRARDPEFRERNSRILKRIAERQRGAKDLKFQTTLAAYYRDEGRFQDADLVMMPYIRRFTGSSNLPDGWDHLFNTYLANAIDQGDPQIAIPQVRTMLAQKVRPEHIFNCARIAWRLPAHDEQREDIFRLVRRRFDDGLMPEKDDGTIKTSAILLEISGKREDAEYVLASNIDPAEGRNRNSKIEIYYYACMLAEILQSRGDELNIDKSIKILTNLIRDDRIGEATFLMARAHALINEYPRMALHLEASAALNRKWIMKCSFDPAFKGIKSVEDLLSIHAGSA